MKVIHIVTFSLIIIGGVNWLILGVSGWDIGEIFGGQDEMASKVLYILIGLAAVYEISTHKSRCKECAAKGTATPTI